MSAPLKQLVVERLQQRKLDDAQWQRLYDLQQDSAQRTRRRPMILAIAASVLLAALIGLTVIWTPRNVAWEIADEIAMNHLKQRPLEITGENLNRLRPYFDELEFQLLETSRQHSSAFRLAGGRYCSVLGDPAAQLRLRDDSGHTNTLYQVPYDRERFGSIPDIGIGETPLFLQVRGLEVELWVEKGLLFGLVEGEGN